MILNKYFKSVIYLCSARIRGTDIVCHRHFRRGGIGLSASNFLKQFLHRDGFQTGAYAVHH